jgi:hypothetical protein
MTQHLRDLLKRHAGAQHLGRRGMPQPVRPDLSDPSAAARTPDDHRDDMAADRCERRQRQQEQRAMLARGTDPQIRDERLPDVHRQRHRVLTMPLAVHEQLARTPVDVVQPDRGDLPGAQPEPREQHQHGKVAAADHELQVT